MVGGARSLVFVASIALLACEAPGARGATCTRDEECTAPNVCVLGRCRAQCRESRDCEVGARCIVEPATGVSVCSLAEVDTCQTSDCPAGFVCQAGQCLNACGAIARCPDGVCVGDACLPVVGDAGVLPDAGTDAGPACHGPSCDPIVDIDIGGPRTYAVTAAGFGWAWGGAGSSALGDGLVAHGTCANCTTVPVRVLAAGGAPLDQIVEIAAGAEYACARRHDGTVWCWGYGSEGELGQNGGASAVPVQVVDGSGAPIDQVTAIAAGRGHTCVVRGAGREVWCWGQGGHGQLGDGGTSDSPFAVHATAFSMPAAALVVSQTHTLVTLDDGTMRGIGEDQCACVGTGVTTGGDVLSAATGPTTAIASIATTTWNTCALDTAGVVSCFGLADAALGTVTGTFPTCSNCASGSSSCAAAPQIVAFPSGVALTRLLGGGDGVYFAFTAEDELYVWGGIFGAPIAEMPTPSRVGIADHPRFVDADVYAHLCVLTAEGDVYCVGANDQGELGRGTMGAMDGRLLPVVWP